MAARFPVSLPRNAILRRERRAVRVMFWLYIVVSVAGIVLYTGLGLAAR
jgi:hypothetical protein